jgi:hypothetical protein
LGDSPSPAFSGRSMSQLPTNELYPVPADFGVWIPVRNCGVYNLTVLMQYLVYVSPFARALPLDRRESEYLFGDAQGPWAGEELSETLGRITAKHLGVRLTGYSFRWGAA